MSEKLTTFWDLKWEGSRLLKVCGIFWQDEEDGLLEEVRLSFEDAEVSLLAQGEFDELAVTFNAPKGSPGSDLSAASPWRDAVGRPLLWAWTMTNEGGYLDGIQLAFARSVEDTLVTIQLQVMASQLHVFTVTPFAS